MTQEWMKDSTLEGIDPAKNGTVTVSDTTGKSKKNQKRNACIFNVRSSQFKEKRTAVQPRRDGYDYKGVKKKENHHRKLQKMDRILSMMKMLRRG